MKPSPKYATCALLYYLDADGMWEYDIFASLERSYPSGQLTSLREELVGLSTLGWLDTVEQKESRGRILRRYRLHASIRPVIEYQLKLEKLKDVVRAAGIEPTVREAVAS
ncbi:hypothetical protein ACX9R5_01575 [Rathayibacter sp. CAU 1779]